MTNMLLNSSNEIRDGIIPGSKLVDVTITATKIADGAISAVKLGTDVYGKWVDAPANPMTPTTTGTKGDFTYLSGYMYFCVAANTWVRIQSTGSW